MAGYPSSEMGVRVGRVDLAGYPVGQRGELRRGLTSTRKREKRELVRERRGEGGSIEEE
ncbi:hypothetical protein Dimus_037147, partial [Dionaea muscipula]